MNQTQPNDSGLTVTPAAGPWVYEEQALADALGMTRPVLTRTRVKKLSQGVHWELVALRVMYAKNGVAAVVDLLTDPPMAEDALAAILQKIAPEKNGGVSAVEARPATVIRFWLNPRLMEVRFQDGQKVNLTVRDRTNFKLGMEVPVRLVEGHYELARKLPRSPGKW